MNETTSTDPQPAKRPESRRFRVLRRILFGIACLATLIAIYYAQEDWRGKHAWNEFRQEWEAKGEKFELKDFVPPPVPDDQNFAMTPFLAPLFDFNPRPLQPGQSQWRDTNGYNRIENFGTNLHYPKSSAVWAKSEPTDLGAWANLIQGKSNAPVSSAASSDTDDSSRPEAAKVVLQALEQYRPVLDELQAASQRPYSRFNLNYAEEFPAGILLPHLAVVKRMAQMYLLRASAEMALGRTDAALADIKMGLYMSGTVKNEPFLISGLVRIAILQLAIPRIWEGLAAHQWTDAQLAEFETELGKFDLLAEYSATTRGERGLENSDMDYLRKHPRIIGDGFFDESGGQDNQSPAAALPWPSMPAGWFYQNQLVINRMFQAYMLPPVDAPNHRVDVTKLSTLQERMDDELLRGFPPYKIFARLLLPALEGGIRKFAYAQANVDMARVACAMDRYLLANGQYPDSLAVMVPKYISSVPNDVISGEPLKYIRGNDEQFQLYSVGWNGTDDGGKVAFDKSGKSLDITRGDWVWPVYPAK